MTTEGNGEGLDERDQAYQAEADKVTEANEEARPADTLTFTQEERAPKGELTERDQAYQANADEQPAAVAVADRAAEPTEAKGGSSQVSSKVEGGSYDPGANNIGDVVAYVDKNPSELDAVLAAEKAGQNRVTLVQQLETRKA